MPIEIRVNGQTVVCESGDFLSDVLHAAGLSVPTLCRHPRMRPLGACRICVVELIEEGASRVVSSCDFQIVGPVSVRTDTPRILRHREVILGLLLSEAPGASRLHTLARDFHIEPASPPIFEEHTDCIRCGRCVLACQTFAARPAIDMCGRADAVRPAFAFDKETSDDCNRCGACAAVCPTDARRAVVGLSSKSGPPCNFCMVICPDAAVSISPCNGEPVMDETRCKACGLCIHYCPSGALRTEASCDR